MADLSAHAIAKYCRERGVATSTFGREAIGDPALFRQLQQGRELRPGTAARVRLFMESAHG